jgi:uncharacterized protein
MQRQDIIERLKSAQPKLKGIGVGSLFLFGSHARNEAGEHSDIDVFVDPVEGAMFGFDAFMESFELIQRSFPGTEIGFGTRRGIVPQFRPSIEAAAIRVF